MSDPGNISQPPVRWRARWSTRLVRRAGFYWLVALVLAVVTAAAVHRLTQRAIDLETAHGQTRTVAVTIGPVARAAPLDRHIEWREIPVAFLPDDVVGTVSAGARSTRAIGAGVILTATDVGAGTTLGADEAALTVPIGPATPLVTQGQPVLVVVHPDPFAGVEGRQVTGTVHRVDEDRLSIAVPRTQIDVVATALNGTGVTLAVL